MDKKNCNIGILTFSYSSNPGSVLQAYALQQTVTTKLETGVIASIINYQKTHAGKPLIGKTVFTSPVRKWTIKKIIRWILQMVAHPLRMRKYEKFFNKYYRGYPAQVCTRDHLEKLNEFYDLFIVGSDQVWNFDSPNVDTTYFLDFVQDKAKKVSYAASFGQSEVPEREYENAKKLLSEFSHISVRESDNIKTVADMTGKQAEWVLDPSLLLDMEDYKKLSIAPRKKRYVFLYLREESPRLEEFARTLALHFNLNVVKVLKHWMCTKKGKPIYAVGPEQWLGYMENAEYVVTNSFHGICFSLIFEKELFVDILT